MAKVSKRLLRLAYRVSQHTQPVWVQGDDEDDGFFCEQIEPLPLRIAVLALCKADEDLVRLIAYRL